MISFFPDLNVWLALSVAGHVHNSAAWKWLGSVHGDHKLIMSRFTQIGLLRLLTNSAVMGAQTLTLREAWGAYDRWLEDPRVDFYPEPRGIDVAFRQATEPFGPRPASKWVGDCWLLAYAREIQATLVTFDRGLYEFAKKQDCSAAIPV
jgi:toxin-antitoxin system PIN domain toxin